LDTRWASTVTLGAIALQGVRRCEPTLGETVGVIGLGVLGQITVQLLRASGCRTIGSDVDGKRVRAALENGMDFGATPEEEDLVGYVNRLTDGFGADAVIVTAATESSQVISQAMQACRKKGRVVLVGDVGLDLNRNDMYKKELDLLMSCSYGPGRYDPYYEEGGNDYPLPYVRWTENRNMQEYIRLIASGRLELGKLSAADYPIDRAVDAYEALKAPGEKPLLVFLSYPESQEAPQRTVVLRSAPSKPGRVRVGVAGAGSFTASMHLPNMVKLRDRYEVRGVMSRTGSNATGIATQFSAAYATTDYQRILTDQEIDLVLIGTRHNLHGKMVLEALRAGKNVFVEKPLTIFPEELEEIEAFYRAHSDAPLLMTGFNRRFAPAIQKIRAMLKGRTTPLLVNYRMNAGPLPPEHWTHSAEGGGRNLGEACHIYDLFAALTGASPVSVVASAITPSGKQWHKNDNFVATICYSDGSACTLTYTALGSKSYPKERMEIFADGRVLSLDDYQSVAVAGAKGKGWKSMTTQKGQLEELEALAASLLQGAAWPIPLQQQIETTRVAFEVERQIMQQPDGRKT
jgi:predicted dehydrogenase